MGMLVNGKWTDVDRTTVDGAYFRPKSSVDSTDHRSLAKSISDHPGRYWLIASSSCPWSHRVTMVRALKGLSGHIPMHRAHGERIEGYPLEDGALWSVPGSDLTIRHLHELYSLHDRHHTGRVTVPVLWDSESRTIVSNESADLVRTFDLVDANRAMDYTLRPCDLVREIDDANAWIYDGLNNAVYRAGFAREQRAYEEAVALVFQTLDALETRFAGSRYFFSETLTETDIRLFPTLVRFDAIYHVLFKCCRRRLVDYPDLWAYARDLYAWYGVAQTVDFHAMRTASYRADSDSPHPIVAVAPDSDWGAAHGREAVGRACLIRPGGRRQHVDPEVLEPVG